MIPIQGESDLGRAARDALDKTLAGLTKNSESDFDPFNFEGEKETFEDFLEETIKQLAGELKTKIKKEEKKNLKNEIIVDKEFLVSLIDVYFILKNMALKSKEINLRKPEVLEKMKNLEKGFEMDKETFFSVLKKRQENLNPLIKAVFDLFQNNKNTPKTSAELLELLGDKIFLLQPKNKINPTELGRLLSKVKKLFEYNSKTRKWKLIDDYYESGRL